jgi:hypothetical protein
MACYLLQEERLLLPDLWCDVNCLWVNLSHAVGRPGFKYRRFAPMVHVNSSYVRDWRATLNKLFAGSGKNRNPTRPRRLVDLLGQRRGGMLGPSGNFLTANLFFEHELAVLLVTPRLLLEKLLDRDTAILCGQFARISIQLAFARRLRLRRLRCHLVRVTLPPPSGITADSLIELRASSTVGLRWQAAFGSSDRLE